MLVAIHYDLAGARLDHAHLHNTARNIVLRQSIPERDRSQSCDNRALASSDTGNQDSPALHIKGQLGKLRRFLDVTLSILFLSLCLYYIPSTYEAASPYSA